MAQDLGPQHAGNTVAAEMCRSHDLSDATWHVLVKAVGLAA
jgi:hypothetical protein